MSVENQAIDENHLLLKIKLTPSEYVGVVESELKKIKKKISLPGFRKGFVPDSHIKNLYGKSVLAEELDKMINKEIQEHVKEHKINTIGQPLPVDEENNKNYSWDFKDTFEFNFELGIYEAFEIPAYDSIKLEKKKAVIAEKDIENKIEDIRTQSAKFKEVEEVVDEESILQVKVKVNRKEPTEEGKDFFETTAHLSLNHIENKAFKKEVKKFKKIDDTCTLQLKNLFKKEPEKLSQMLYIEAKELEQLEDDFELRVVKIYVKEKPELNDDFFNNIPEKEGIKNIDDLKSKIKEDLEQDASSKSMQLLYGSINEYLKKEVKINLPTNFLEKWIKRGDDKLEDSEDFKKQFDLFLEATKWDLIVEKIFGEEKLEVKQDEIVQFAKAEIYYRMYTQYPNQQIDAEQLHKSALELLKDNQKFSEINRELKSRKVLSALAEKIKIKEREVSFEKLFKE